MKFCVFCGKKPEQKTMEHVAPQWLIEFTGDRKRKARFGPYWDDKKGSLGFLNIPFDQFMFPACDRCNEKYSKLEEDAKRIVVRIFDDQPLSANDVSIFLSWLDKVRVGLWLGAYYLHKKVSDIEPHMFIDTRVEKFDRLVFIYKSDLSFDRLNFVGTYTPAFQYSPTCFTLYINNIAFFNMSTAYLISRRMGLPFPEETRWGEWPKIEYSVIPGRERITLPIIRKSINVRCSQIYQPIFSSIGRGTSRPNFYNTDYVHSLSLDYKKGIGKVFEMSENKLQTYPSEPVLNWIPKYIWENEPLENLITKQTLEFQLYMLALGPSYKSLDSERGKIAKMQHQLAQTVTREILKIYTLSE